MAAIPSFIFGAGTKYKTQEELDRAREQVKALLGDIGQSQYEGWGGVLADLGKGISARVEKGRIGEGQNFLTGKQDEIWSQFPGYDGGYGGGEGSDALIGGGGSDSLAGGGSYPSAVKVDQNEYTQRLADIAREEGWDPNVVLSVVKQEGGFTNPVNRSQAILKKTGRQEHSYGPLQLNVEGGVGELALNAGIDPRDPAQWEDAYRFGLRHAAKRGWGEWMGARKIGLRGTTGYLGPNASLSGGGGSNAQAGGGAQDEFWTAPRRRMTPQMLGQPNAPGFPDLDARRRMTPSMFGTDEEPVPPPAPVAPSPLDDRRRMTPAMMGGVRVDDGGGPSLIQARPVPVNAAGLNTPRGQEFLGRMTSPAPMGKYPLPLVPGMDGPMPQPVGPGLPMPPQPMPASPRQPTPPVPSALFNPQAMGAPQTMRPPVGPDPTAGRLGTPPPSMAGTETAPYPIPGNSMAGTERVPPQFAPTPAQPPIPVARQQVDPFTDMILGDKAAQFKPGNVTQSTPAENARGLLAAQQLKPFGANVFPAAPPAPGTPAAAGFGVPQQAMAGGGGANRQVGGGGGQFPPAPAAPGQRGGGGPQDKIGKLMTILASPYASDEQKRMATAMLQREYDLEDERRKAEAERADPAYKLGLRKAELEIKKLENAGAAVAPMSPADRQRFGIPEDDKRPWMLVDGKPEIVGGANAPGEEPALINLGDGVLYDPKTRKVVYDKNQGAPPPPDFDDTSAVRKEITALPSYKNLAQATPIWSSVVSAADRKTTQADLNIILGIAKIMDPTSVVRTEEGESVRDTGGATTELSKWFSYLKSNSDAVLDDSIREKLLNEGYSRVKGYEDEYAADTEFYGQFADRKKIDRADIIRAFPPARQWKPGQASPSVKNKADKYLGGGG